MKICCVGWTGPSLDEIMSGVLPYDPGALFLETGNGSSCSEARWYGTNHHRRKISEPGQIPDLANRHDVVLLDTYYFSAGHRDDLYSYFPDGSDLLLRPELDDVKAFKVLCETEATAGPANLKFYREAARRCDAVLTFSAEFKAWCDAEKIPCHLDVVGISPIFVPGSRYRDIDVIYSGSRTREGYRGKLAAVLDGYGKRRHVEVIGTVPLPRYMEFLQRTKIVLCTMSCASGEQLPYGPKHKGFKALLSGCVPLEERWPDGPEHLQTWAEKAVFDSPEQIPDVCEMLLKDPAKRAEIVSAGSKRVLENYLYHHVFGRAFKALGL